MAQRSVVPCLALRFAVLCRAALYVLLIIQQQLLLVVAVPGMVQIPGLCTCFVYSCFCFLLQINALSRSPCPLPRRKNLCGELIKLCFFHPPEEEKKKKIARFAVQNVTSTSTQHSAGQLALHKHLFLGVIIKSLFAPNNTGPLLPAPFIYMFQLLIVAFFFARA